MASVQWGSFADADFKELVASADPTLNISERPVSERYILGDEIGCGSYGRAVLATRIEDGLSVVVKQIRLFEMDEKARMDTLNEVKVLAQFNHVNIVHYHECMLEGGVLNIVMEYANGGDLASAIQRRQQEKKPFSEDEIMFWFVQVVLALYHVHGKNVLHRDLKSQNIFIGEGNLLKLGDFGIARVLNSDTELARTVIGSPYYLSPEICEDRPYNRKSDVWSLGCVLYELTTLRRAFDGQSLPALVVKILRGKYPPVPTRYSSPLRALIESMLKQDPKDRPTADVILRKDFVRQHLERYAAHVVALGLGLGPGGGRDGAEAGRALSGGGGGGGGSGSVAAAALGLAALGAAEPRPRPSPAPHRTPRLAAAARPPRVPAPCGATPGPAAAAAAALPSAASSPAPPAAAAAAGVAGLGEAERCSSYDVSETDTGSTTPAEGCSPSKAVLAARRGQQRLVDSGWVRQQQAALAQLEGALAAQRGAAAGAGGAGGGGGGGGGEAPELRSPGDGAAAMEATVLGGGGPSGDRAGGFGVGAGAAGATGFAGVTAAKAKLAELKVQRDAELEAQRRANAAAREQKKAAAARRNHEAAAAVRNRAVERQKEIERNLAEQKAEMEAKAQKALQLASAIKAKEDARRREQEEVAHHMSAHREHVKAARSRINKDQLAELGAQFASRMATALSGGVPGGGLEAAAGGPQVLVVDFGAAHQQQQDANAAKAAGRLGAGATAAAAAAGRHKAGGPGQQQSPATRAQRPSAAAAAVASDSDGGAGPSGRSRPAVEPPWKQRHRPTKAPAEFPDVQIFTPFGSDAAAASPPAPAASAASGAGPGTTIQAADSGGEADADDGEQQATAGVLEVLAQIHTVLEEEQHDEPPEAGDDDGAASAAAAGRPPPPPRGGAAAAAANALKVEELRIDLERQLGAEAFLAAYRCLRDMQERADAADGDADGGAGGGGGGATSGGGAGAGGFSTQSDLERILGPKLHLARQVHKLITLEEAVFS
ncbi:hypothetical protein PLESTB_000959900 [Pleodorina starrii]|uniref:non-specific serine/threonine protein kinase n=1 Tax=Pleodorina starrii TaxID=330485 RepID=A0A9W6BNA1_9CHLO|nr:hypothetical protein PLESTB_000959900 [Pleodorina starrii]GLC71035.1 hypothetical protein PLESTF_001063200 [Pleodorina starrii]